MCSTATASSPLLIRVKSSDVMDLTSHSSTPVHGVGSVTDVVFSGDRKKSANSMPRPPKDLKILKQESMVRTYISIGLFQMPLALEDFVLAV